ncbi:hypothetical protein BDC45DRAFT_496340 [Circinella umbellata]|nr:hypothetical protein BDC45DRAFT_496340 [Circinella umbellata]
MEISEIIHREQTASSKRPFLCTYGKCVQAFARRSDLVRHLRIHTNDRPFKCKEYVCGKRFIQRSALTVHMRTHTGEKPHLCEYPKCAKRFSDSSSLARHRKTHTGRRSYRCSENSCTKRFVRKTTLIQHMKSEHPPENQEKRITRQPFDHKRQLQQYYNFTTTTISTDNNSNSSNNYYCQKHQTSMVHTTELGDFILDSSPAVQRQKIPTSSSYRPYHHYHSSLEANFNQQIIYEQEEVTSLYAANNYCQQQQKHVNYYNYSRNTSPTPTQSTSTTYSIDDHSPNVKSLCYSTEQHKPQQEEILVPLLLSSPFCRPGFSNPYISDNNSSSSSNASLFPLSPSPLHKLKQPNQPMTVLDKSSRFIEANPSSSGTMPIAYLL